MHGLVSLLPAPYYQEVQSLWKDLELQHGLQGIKVTPYPHFSWQIAEEYDDDRLEERIQTFVREEAPITVRTAGLSIFSGPRPVIVVSIVKNMALMELHARLWHHFNPVGKGVSPWYQPEQWMPHISLAYEDVDQKNIAQTVQWLSPKLFAWEMVIDNLALIYEPSGSIGELRYHFKFQGGGETT